MKRSLRSLWRKDDGAVAPTVALSLFALIASGGIAFDYARLAAMDTELQQAADMAALAAATQLDRTDGSRDRATDSITDTSSSGANLLAANITRFENDADAPAVEIETITFCKAFDDDNPDTEAACDDSDVDDSNAAIIVVKTTARTANYALTPIVAAFAGTVRAEAVAGVESSICNVAPLLICAPSADFPTDADIGRGIVLKPFGGQDSWAPGNYGLLDFGNGQNAVIDALVGHGLNGCQSSDDNRTEPGVKDITDAVNTRMDVYGGNPATRDPDICDSTTGSGCPAPNTGKDMARSETYVVDTDPTQTVQPPAPACGQSGASFPGTLTIGDSFALNTAVKGFTRDTCHYNQSCQDGNIGDGSWDFDAYMAANHASVANPDEAVGGTTRWKVYQWELANDPTSGTLDPQAVSAPAPTTELKKIRGVNRKVWTFAKQCAHSRPVYASATYAAQKDRRLLPVVAADCTNLHGSGQMYQDYTLLRVFDIFLTEPSLDRAAPGVGTDEKEIYAEIVGPAETVGGGTGFQYYSRNRPYLIR